MRGGFEKNVYPYSNYRRRYLNMALDLFWAFLVGGALCAVGQVLIDYTKLTPARRQRDRNL